MQVQLDCSILAELSKSLIHGPCLTQFNGGPSSRANSILYPWKSHTKLMSAICPCVLPWTPSATPRPRPCSVHPSKRELHMQEWSSTGLEQDARWCCAFSRAELSRCMCKQNALRCQMHYATSSSRDLPSWMRAKSCICKKRVGVARCEMQVNKTERTSPREAHSLTGQGQCKHVKQHASYPWTCRASMMMKLLATTNSGEFSRRIHS